MSNECSTRSPLFLPCVLESMLKMLNREDLFACRLVCKLWAEEAGRIIGMRLVINVHALSVSSALRKIKECSNISFPFKKLQIVIPASHNANLATTHSFSTVTSLDLKCASAFTARSVINFFPKLESLCMDQCHAVRDWVLTEPFADAWEQDTLPRLRELELSHLCVDSLESAWVALVNEVLEKAVKLESLDLSYMETEIAAAFINKVCSSNLKRLRVSNLFISDMLLTAVSSHPIYFHLETIDLEDIMGDAVSKSGIKHLLARHSLTLRDLVLQFKQTFEMDFPLGVCMKELQTLRIDHFRGSMEWKILPQLKKVSLLCSTLEGIASSILYAPTFCHVEALGISEPEDEVEHFIQFFREIAECLGPQLKSLELDNACFPPLLPVIFANLTQLRLLKLLGFQRPPPAITDVNLCGAESLTFTPPREGIFRPPLNKAYQRMIASAKKSNHARGPNITYLKDLQFLTLRGEFSEVALLYGILQCEKLQELTLFSPGYNWMLYRDRFVHILANAGLKHLTSVKFNLVRINHLPLRPESSGAVNLLQVAERLLRRMFGC